MEKKEKEPSSVLENSLSALLEDAVNLNHLSFTHTDKIKHYKLTKIKNLHDKLIVTLPISFKSNIEDYNKTVKALEKTGISLDVPFALTTYCYPIKHNDAVTYDFYSEESFNQFFNDMELIGSVDYMPPNDMREVMNHLFCLWNTFQFIWKVPSFKSLEPCLDLSLSKISDRVTNFYDYCIFYKERELNRYEKANITLKDKTISGQNEVETIFYKSDKIRPGMKRRAVAKEIQKKLSRKKNGKPLYGLTQIVEILRTNERLAKEFVPKGKFWIIKT
ncbi:MAG: hypothetical protein C4567_16305 [Deltaproteobacteria bacterium]|nr:MAG: hypothetical protein C4567_16305 [Deltaproteobacteria bacterium]